MTMMMSELQKRLMYDLIVLVNAQWISGIFCFFIFSLPPILVNNNCYGTEQSRTEWIKRMEKIPIFFARSIHLWLFRTYTNSLIQMRTFYNDSNVVGKQETQKKTFQLVLRKRDELMPACVHHFWTDCTFFAIFDMPSSLPHLYPHIFPIVLLCKPSRLFLYISSNWLPLTHAQCLEQKSFLFARRTYEVYIWTKNHSITSDRESEAGFKKEMKL